jgi:hypothetical protein
MGLITKSRLTAITETKLGTRLFSAQLNEARAERKEYTSTSVFLSHSHDDSEIVKKAAVFFRHNGIRIYVDWLDPSMPPITNGETAEKIKTLIKQCDKFVLLATNNAIASKWCNWELGYGDAHKYINKIALFPLPETSSNWTGTEYLRIYPRIQESDSVSESFKVIYPNSRELSISEWLKL